MDNTLTLKIQQSDLEKFNLELTRVVAILQEHQRESEERRERIAGLQADSEKIKQEIRKAREDVEKYLVLH